MELGAIILLLGLLTFVGLFVAQPFSRQWRIKDQSTHEVSTLLAERERALNALVELDFDQAIGKIPAEEYSTQRAQLIQKGSEILRQLDQIQAVSPSSVIKAAVTAAAEQQAQLLSDEDLEDLVAKRRASRNQKTSGFCHNCGKPILQSDQYCPSCGQIISKK